MPGLLYGRVQQDQKDCGDYQKNLDADKKTKSVNSPKFSFGTSSRFGGKGPDVTILNPAKKPAVPRQKEPALIGASSSVGRQVRSNMRSYGACSFATSQRDCNTQLKPARPKEIVLATPGGLGKQPDSKYRSPGTIRFAEGGNRLFPMLQPDDPREVKPPLAEARASTRGDSGLGLDSHVSTFGKVTDGAIETRPRMVFGKSKRGLTYEESKAPVDKPKLYDLSTATFKQSQYESGGSAWMGSMPVDKAGKPVHPRNVNKANGLPGPGAYAPLPLKGPPAYNMGAPPNKAAVVTNACAKRPYAHCAF